MFPRKSGVFLLSVVRVMVGCARQVCKIHSRYRQALIRYTLLPFLAIGLPLTAQAVFTTPGSFEVGPDGSAGYSIPIQVPPSTAGMEPKLSLTYSSNGGNGVLGIGWSLEGLSQITRCAQTRAQDGAIRGINFDANDRYCIDGQRLIAANGTYGGDGVEYRSELANFAKIVSYGTAGTGPAWFKVWTKGGQVIEYGNTADSRIEAQGKSSVITWGVNKISDTKNNYLTVSYTEDNANGETVVSRIDYTGNAAASLAPYASVQFTYETRPDPGNAYLAGSVIKSTKRMTNIKTYAGTTLVMEYRLAYGQSPATQRSRLTTVTQCAGDGSCLLPARLTWQERNNVLVDKGAWATGKYGTWNDASGRIRPMDVNGDGRDDIVLGPNASGQWFVLRSTGTGFVDDGAWISGAYSGLSSRADLIRPMDVNGDGLQDLVLGPMCAGYVSVLRSTGTSFIDDGAWFSGGYGGWCDSDATSRIRPMDVNGDGRDDIVMGPNSSGQWFVLRSTGTSFADDGAWISGAYSGWTGAAGRIRPMDVNGDGLQDIVLGPSSSTGNWFVLRSTGTGFVDDGAWISGAYSGLSSRADLIRPMDVNGDGLQDLVLGPMCAGYVSVMRSTGTSFIDDGAWFSGGYGGWCDSGATSRIRPMDVNGDGRDDIVMGPNSSGQWFVLRSTGTSFADDGAWISGAYSGWTGAAGRIRPMDVNGDGLQDIVLGPSSSTGNWFVLSGNPPADSLIRVYNDLGQETAITYKPLTDPAVYAKDSGSNAAAYPVQDMQEPLYVVSSVSTSDGLGGNVVTNYTYGGAKADLSGRGFLGFRWTKAASPDTGIDLTTFYQQTYPYIGLPAQSEKRTSTGVLLSAVSNTYANTPLTSGSAVSQFPYVLQTLENQYELNGSLVTSTTTTYQYDAYGNATQVTVNSNDGHVKTTANLYANDPVNWLLGRLLRSSVTTTAP